MAAPVWFDPKVYFNNKLAWLEGYNDLTLTAAFTGAGYGVDADGLYRHFQDFGNAENVSPSAYFDAGYYMQAKAATYFGKAVNTVTGAEVSFVQEAFRQAGLSAWDHYLRYGMAEGVDPSASFDTSAYMDAKLAQMQKTDPSYTMDMLVQAFRDAGLNPVMHYLSYGRGEGLTIQDAQHGAVTKALTTGIDNLVGTTGTPTVDAAGNLVVNSNYDDYFTAETGTLHSADDLVVLGPNAGRMDIIELRGNFGNDTVVGFRSGEDMINLAAYLDSTKPLNAGAPAGLVNNSAIVATLTGPKAESGIYTQAEVDALVKDGNLSLTGANGDKAVAFLQAVNSEGQNVYTIVQMSTDGTTDKGTVMGSMTLDSVNGVKTSIANTDFRLDSVIRDSVTGKTYGPADYTATGTLDGTFFADTFNDVNSTTLGTVTTIDGKEGDDTFNITGDLGGTITLEGGEGNDTFNVKSAAPINGGTIDGGAGFDTLTVDKMLTGNATLTALNNVENATFDNTGTVTITNMATADNASTLTAANTVTSLTINTLKADVATTIDGSLVAGAVTVNASTSTAAVTLKGGTTGAANLTGGDGNDTIITTGTGTSDITSGKGDDTIQLGSTGKDTVKFAANLAANGHDTITGFEAGAGKDVLDGTAFYTTKAGLAAAVDGSANDLNIGNAGTNNIGVLYNVAGGVLTADKVVTSGTAANGEVIIDAGKKAVVMVTADSAGAAATYNMYYVTGDATAPTVELVGTVTTDAAFDAGNFA